MSDPGYPAWARDGRSLYLSGVAKLTDPPLQSFEVRDVRGRVHRQRILHTAGVAEEAVAVSPEGRRIAYLANPRDRRQVNTGDLVVAPLEGGPARRLLTRVYGTPAWSPDGRR